MSNESKAVWDDGVKSTVGMCVLAGALTALSHFLIRRAFTR